MRIRTPKIYKRLYGPLADEYFTLVRTLNENFTYCAIKFPIHSPTPITDLDIIISPEQFLACKKFLASKGFITHRTPRFEPDYYAMKKYIPGKGFVSIDVYKTFLTSKPVLDTVTILSERIQDSGSQTYLPSPAHDYTITFIHPPLRNRDYKRHELDTLRYYRNSKVRPASLNRRSCHFHRLMAGISWLMRVLNPTPKGPVISLIGPDGSGKSTLAKALKEKLERGGLHARTAYLGWKPLLPSTKLLGLLAKNKKGQSTGRSRSKRVSTLPLSKLFTYTNYYLEYLARYLLNIYPLQRRSQIVITDRHPYDIFAQDTLALRSTYLRELFKKFYPRPDLCVYLDVPPSKILKRKKDLTKEQITEQKRKYTKLAELFKAERAQASGTPEQISDKILTNNWKRVVKRLRW